VTELKQDDEYEEMASAFQCALVQTLDQALHDQGLALPVRRAVCESFARHTGVLLDQCWVESGVGRVFPIVGFARTHPDYDPQEIVVNAGGFSFAEYAGGNIHWYFDEHDPEAGPQRIGVVGDDGKPTE
jgi:hypothetical protein